MTATVDTVTVERAKLYQTPGRSHPGPAWRWSYTYRVNNGPVCQYGPGLASLRSLLKRKFSGATIKLTWED